MIIRFKMVCITCHRAQVLAMQFNASWFLIVIYLSQCHSPKGARPTWASKTLHMIMMTILNNSRPKMRKILFPPHHNILWRILHLHRILLQICLFKPCCSILTWRWRLRITAPADGVSKINHNHTALQISSKAHFSFEREVFRDRWNSSTFHCSYLST